MNYGNLYISHMDVFSEDYNRAKNYALGRIRRYSKAVESGCIEWQRWKSKQGYGQISFTITGEGTRAAYAHRLLWELTHNVELGRNICICHRCDNPSCVNIEHLFVGTRKDNSQDMARKGRAGHAPRDPSKPLAKYKEHKRIRKFTDNEIIQIREATGSLKEVSDMYGVSQGYISKLRSRKAKLLVV